MTMEELQQIVLQEIINCDGTVEKKNNEKEYKSF